LQNRKFSVALTGEAAEFRFKIDDVVVCRPDSIDYVALKAICSKSGSVSKTAAVRPDIPRASSFVCTVEELDEKTRIVSVEVMCLSESLSREIQTKEGIVKRAEVTVADHTGEIKAYAWRNLSKLLENFSPGERIILRGFEVQSFENKKFLVAKNYSQIERLSSST